MSGIQRDDDLERREADRAGAEAAAIGGSVSSDPPPADEAERPLAEAGQGESEGFEAAEQELVERASHGDQHAARHAVDDAPGEPDDVRIAPGGEADREFSSEREDDR